MKLLTVCVPCYNSAAYIRKCIESLLPGGADIEILIVNDGSTDQMGTMAEEYQRLPTAACALTRACSTQATRRATQSSIMHPPMSPTPASLSTSIIASEIRRPRRTGRHHRRRTDQILDMDQVVMKALEPAIIPTCKKGAHPRG